MRCSPTPPLVISEFFAGTPPKVTNSLVCAAITSHEVCEAFSSSIEATMCGISVRAAPRL